MVASLLDKYIVCVVGGVVGGVIIVHYRPVCLLSNLCSSLLLFCCSSSVELLQRSLDVVAFQQTDHQVHLLQSQPHPLCG